MRYLPLTADDRAAMLATIGAPDIDALFADVPEAARARDLFDLPLHQSEMAVERALAGLAARNRPAELADSNPEAAAYEERVRQAVKKGKISAADVARVTIDAVKDNRFYILTHANIKPAVEMRLRDIIDGGQPRNPMP